MRALMVGAAGAAGALGRYGIGVFFGVRSFPWPTMGINLVGSFLLGIVLVFGTTARLSDDATVAIAVGFLGAFTTFSTFSYETMTMLRTGRPTAAAAYVGVSVIAGIASAALGYRLGNALT